ncbi:hypothetical protein [Achromobacter xylosoxidans]|uniref:Uncharacterized protein n=1 Tax=Alcaligenes xylosoxydans xylosoxydans TaxID=85698 RepID=A0A424W564_ALCXX|nr:hypothetical protein [Achromobacter xylosoxidans]MBC9904791.1 hypothetical protein [Achromobacter xylosoxidans]MBD0868708.1 hypothetical protein [Achromobacter xylosoxidans]QNP87789.1 hypothetical protein IAG39_09885 [Achromobacter xylosoxidans]RPJ88436.1 hypothetical protein DY367_27910 [Achromobacter xylosoxidans]
MKRAIILFTVILAGCNADASAPTIEKHINAEVSGYTGTPRKFLDVEAGVTCYYISYRAISCVKTH